MNKTDSTLRRIFLFEHLSEDDIQKVKSFCTEKSVSKGEIIFSEGQKANSFYYVIDGAMKLYKLSSDGAEVILHFQREKELVAEAIIFEFDTYPAFCEAIEASRIIEIRKDDFLNFLNESQDVVFEIMKAYSRRLRQLLLIIEDFSLHNVKTRLANFLLNNSTLVGGELICKLNISKKDLSSRLGTIPETLSRTLKFFKSEKIIEEKSDLIIIKRKKFLENYLP